MAIDRKVNIFNEVLWWEDPKIAQIGVYSVTILGLAAAAQLVRPFKRFSRPADIPNRFINFRTKLHGTVERVEPNGPFIMVQHKPIIHLLRTKVDCLPVKISGVAVDGHGISWLQSIVTANDVSFIPVLKQKDCIQSEVFLHRKMINGETKTINIGANLIEVGFGKVDKLETSLANDPLYKLYLKQLETAEYIAEKNRLGYWYYMKIVHQATLNLLDFIIKLLKAQSAKSSAKSKSSSTSTTVKSTTDSSTSASSTSASSTTPSSTTSSSSKVASS